LNYKQLLQAKQNYEVYLREVNEKLAKMQQEGQPLSKQQKHIQYKIELLASLQTIQTELNRYQQLQQQYDNNQQQQQQTNNKPTMPADWNPVTGRTEIPGQGRRAAGKVMIALGIFFSVFGFILSIIGVILYASGNSA
jgi:multidrug resistance efflux pump